MDIRAKLQGRLEVNRVVYTRVEFDEFAEKIPAVQKTCCQHVSETMQNCCHCSRNEFLQKLMGVFPFINVLRTYNFKSYLLRDIVAGLSVGMVHIPQGMGFAILANLAPVYGLYTSFFPVIVYFFFGSCKHVSVGTMAVLSLIIGSVVETEANKFLLERGEGNMTDNNAVTATWFIGENNASSTMRDTTDQDLEVYKASIASAMALISGAIMLLMGILRLGSITALMPRPFISGFTTGAAFHIVTSQLKSLFGIEVKGFNGILKLPYTWIEICRQIPTTHIPTLIIALISIAILAFFKEFINEKFKKKLPVPIPIEMVVVLLGTSLSYFLDFNSMWNVRTVGLIPRGIPAPFMPPLEKTPYFLTDAIISAILSLTITISMAEIVSRNEKTTVDANQEFIASGLCYGLSSFFFCFMGAAAPPRCLIMASTGGKTQVANVFTVLLLLLVLLVIGPFFGSLPLTVLAGVIVVALLPLFKQFQVLPDLWRLSKVDFSIWVVTWVSAILLNMDLALGIGIGWSILTVALTAMKARGYSLGQTKHQDLFASSEGHSMVSTPEGVAIYRYESSLFFASIKGFKSQLYGATVDPQSITPKVKVSEAEMLYLENTDKADGQEKMNNGTEPEDIRSTEELAEKDETKSFRAIILDCSPFAYVDLMGINTLKQLSADYDSVNIKFMLANCTSNLLHKLEIDGQIGGEGGDKMHTYPTIQDALAAVTADAPPEAGREVTTL